VRRENPVTKAYALTTSSVTRFGLGFSPTYLRLQTEEEKELEGKRVGGLFILRPVCARRFFRAMISPTGPCFLIFYQSLLIVLYPPLSPFVLRALRHTVVALIVLVRISLRYP